MHRALDFINGSGDQACSGYGREVLIELDGATFSPGAGSRGCSNTRMINPFRTPTITAPAGPFTIRGGVGYCRGSEVNGVVVSQCTNELHVASEITLTPGGSAGGGGTGIVGGEANEYTTPVVTTSATSISSDWVTFSFSVDLKGEASNVYSIFGKYKRCF